MYARYLIVYDIADNARLQKVAKIMEDFGERMQKSVFEAHLNPEQLTIMTSRLRDIINKAEDGIKIFKLCEACSGGRTGLGVMKELLPYSPWQIL